jgi:hypothetical protein
MYRPGQALRASGDEAPRFHDSRHINMVGLSALRTGCVDPRAIVRSEGLGQ